MPIKFNEGRVTIEDKELLKVPDVVFKKVVDWFYYLKVKETILKSIVKADIVNKDGKFFKRLQKYLMQVYKERAFKGLELSYTTKQFVERHLEEFRVNIIDKETMNFNGYSFEFSDEFDWEAGDFGDPDSCFFEDSEPKDYMVEKLEGNNFKALKLYKGNKGIGRGLLLPDCLCSRANGKPVKGWLLMNCYGISINRMSDILKSYWRVPATQIELHDSDLCGEDMYINNGTAIYLGPKVIRKRRTLYMRGTVYYT